MQFPAHEKFEQAACWVLHRLIAVGREQRLKYLELSCIANMDETGVWAYMPSNSHTNVRGSKTVQIASTRYEKERIRIYLAVFADRTHHLLSSKENK